MKQKDRWEEITEEDMEYFKKAFQALDAIKNPTPAEILKIRALRLLIETFNKPE